MHFKNGRPAQAGDHVIAKSYNGNIVGGVIFDLNDNGSKCNCSVAVIQPGAIGYLTCQDVGQMIHVEDALAASTPLAAISAA